MDSNHAVAAFQGKGIRRTWHNEEWWFSVVDIVGALTDSEDPRNYWKVLKHRLTQESGSETVTNCNQLKLPAEDSKMRLTDCVNTEGAFIELIFTMLGENYLSEPEKKKKLEDRRGKVK